MCITYAAGIIRESAPITILTLQNAIQNEMVRAIFSFLKTTFAVDSFGGAVQLLSLGRSPTTINKLTV
jgi:hypothetical protein